MSRIQIVFEFDKGSMAVFDVQAKRADIPKVVIMNCQSIFDFGDADDSFGPNGDACLKHNYTVSHHLAKGGVINHFFDLSGMFEYIAHQDERFAKKTELWEYSLICAPVKSY